MPKYRKFIKMGYTIAELIYNFGGYFKHNWDVPMKLWHCVDDASGIPNVMKQ